MPQPDPPVTGLYSPRRKAPRVIRGAFALCVRAAR